MNNRAQQHDILSGKVKENMAEIHGRISIFLGVIEDSAMAISRKINQSIEENALSDDFKAFLSDLEEDAEEITKAAMLLREGLIVK